MPVRHPLRRSAAVAVNVNNHVSAWPVHRTMRRTGLYAGCMKTVQIRNVPDALHRRLKVRAAQEGRSMSDLVLDEIRRSLDRPTRSELLERIAQRDPVEIDSAAEVRAERDAR